MDKLLQAAKDTKSPDEFIGHIRKHNLLDEVYKYEHLSKENELKYRLSGWFGIATDFWEQFHK